MKKIAKKVVSLFLALIIVLGAVPLSSLIISSDFLTTKTEATTFEFELKDYNGHSYALINTKMNWHSAKEYCENLGGHLVTITSEDENNFVASCFINGFMIGLTDEKTEGVWEWVTGERFVFKNWRRGEPNNEFNEDYVLMDGTDKAWNDGHCERENWPFICEWDYKEKYNKIVKQMELLDTYVISVRTDSLISDKLVDVKNAVVEFKSGDFSYSKTTDSNGTVAVTRKELKEKGWNGNADCLSVTAKRKIGNEIYLVAGYGKEYMLSYFSSYAGGTTNYIYINCPQFQPTLTIAYNSSAISKDKIDSIVKTYISSMYNLTKTLILPNVSSTYIECDSDTTLINSGADILICGSVSSATGGKFTRANATVNGYNGNGYILVTSNDSVTTLCHESMHYLIGAYDEYCNGYYIKNKSNGENKYHLDFNGNKLIDDFYYIYWVNEHSNILDGSIELKETEFLQKKYSEIDRKLSYEEKSRTDSGSGIYYIYPKDGNHPCVSDGDKIICLGGISEKNGTYWDYVYERPTSFGIMDGNSNQSLKMSTENTYSYLEKSEWGGDLSVDKSNPQWYTAHYYKFGCSVEDKVIEYISGKANVIDSYDILFEANNYNIEHYKIPYNEESTTIAISEVYADDYNSKILYNAKKTNNAVCFVEFSNSDTHLCANLQSDNLNDVIVFVKYSTSNALTRYDLSFKDGSSSISIPKNDIRYIFVLVETSNNEYIYNQYYFENFGEELSDGTHISSIMTVSTENDNTDTLSIFSEENTYTNGEYFSVGKAFNVVDNSADGTEITDNFIQTISYSDDYNLDSVTAFLYDGEIYTELETTVGSGEDNCAYISFPYTGEGKYILMAKAPADTVYEAPTNLLIDAEGSTYEKEIHVSFEDSNNPLEIVAYKLYYSTSEITDTSAEGVMVETLKPGDGSYTLYLNDEYGDYYFYVEALGKDGGKSSLSESYHFSLSPYDSDADGLPDYWIKWYPALSELEDIPGTDTDDDGLTNLLEYQNGTNPLNPDTDGDNVYDSVELWNDLNPLEPMTDGVTDDYIIIYGTPDVGIDVSTFVLGETEVTCSIENNTDGKAMRTAIYLYIGDELVDAGVVNLDSNSSVEYSFSKEYLVDGMRIVLDEGQITRDTDYSNNEFVYKAATGISAENTEVTVLKNTETQLEYVITPDTASDILAWTSSDEDVISVNHRGVIVAKTIGKATVTAVTPSGFSCTYNILVEPFPGAGETEFDCRLINDNTGLEIIGYYGNDKNIIIPDSIGRYPVTSIADNAFNGCDFETIEVNAGIANIGKSVFNGIANLCSIEVNPYNINYCSKDGVLYNADKTALVRYPVAKDNTVFTVPDSTVTIEENAFNGAVNLAVINIPESVIEIKSKSFANLTLTSINFAGSKRIWDIISKPNNSGLSEQTICYGKFTAKFICEGEVISETDYKPEETIVLPDNITEKKYYTFVGWTPTVPETMPEYDMSFTAVYELSETTRTVEYYADSELYWSDYRYAGENVTYPESVPTKEGYTFVKCSPDIVETMPDENLIYEAIWDINIHKVSFMVDGEEYHSYECAYLDSLTAPNDPSKEGYTFAGWTPAIPDTMPDMEMTFTAVFEPITYTATFMYGSEILGTDEFIVSDNVLDYPEIEAKEHYNWVWNDYEIIADDITVTGEYVPIVYTATFVADRITVDSVEFTVENQIVGAPTIPEKVGYSAVWDEYEIVLADFTVNAVYTPIVYTATFTHNGETIGTDEFTVEDSTLNYPSIEQKTYYSWVWDEHKIIADNITINGEYVPITYTIKFVSNGKTVKTQTFNVETADTITPPNLSLPPKTGYISVWEDWGGKIGNLTINEIYVPISYSARFWCEGKLVKTRYFTVENKKSDITMPELLKREGYEVVWQDFEIVPNDIDVYGEYVPIEYTATFIADGVVISTQTFTVETESLDEPLVPQKAGYYARWSSYNIEAKDITIVAKYHLPEAVTVSKLTLDVGDTYRLLPSCNFEIIEKTWVSSNTSVATVNKHGKVTAVGKGECEITTTCYGKDSLGNDIQASKVTKIIVNSNSEANTSKRSFRDLFDEFFEVTLHDFMYNLRKFMVVLFRYAY